MSNADKIKEFMNKYGVAKDEIWQVPGGKSYAIKHSAIERIAFQHNITFSAPTIIEADSANKIATILVTGKLGDFEQWSIGEAAPHNNKNAYTFAMAEKRAKDRVILKLINIHGILYSEDELDEPRTAGKPELRVVNKEPEREETEILAMKKLNQMIETCPTVATLDAMVKSQDWKTALELTHDDDKALLRKAYATRRETLTYKEAN